MHILICVPDRVVAADLVEWGRELGVDYVVQAFASLNELLVAADMVERVAAVLVGGPRDEIEKTALAQTVWGKGGRLIWFGDASVEGALPGGWIAVPIPYGTDALKHAFSLDPGMIPG